MERHYENKMELEVEIKGVHEILHLMILLLANEKKKMDTVLFDH